MSTSILENSRADYQPLTPYEARSAFLPVFPQQEVEMQSSSVTSTNYELRRVGITPASERERKNFALAQLLKSWHEDDELEQPETWERLKQALDEDRLSDRKLFP